MTEMPECPICGKKIGFERTVFGIAVGCKECGMMIPTFTIIGLLDPKSEEGEILREKFEKELIAIWEDTLKKSASLIQSIRTENVLRTAYGMPPVTYLDYVERDCKRLQEKRMRMKERRAKNDNKV